MTARARKNEAFKVKNKGRAVKFLYIFPNIFDNLSRYLSSALTLPMFNRCVCLSFFLLSKSLVSLAEGSRSNNERIGKSLCTSRYPLLFMRRIRIRSGPIEQYYQTKRLAAVLAFCLGVYEYSKAEYPRKKNF